MSSQRRVLGDATTTPQARYCPQWPGTGAHVPEGYLSLATLLIIGVCYLWHCLIWREVARIVELDAEYRRNLLRYDVRIIPLVERLTHPV
jgi:hypothetical protein